MMNCGVIPVWTRYFIILQRNFAPSTPMMYISMVAISKQSTFGMSIKRFHVFLPRGFTKVTLLILTDLGVILRDVLAVLGEVDIGVHRCINH